MLVKPAVLDGFFAFHLSTILAYVIIAEVNLKEEYGRI